MITHDEGYTQDIENEPPKQVKRKLTQYGEDEWTGEQNDFLSQNEVSIPTQCISINSESSYMYKPKESYTHHQRLDNEDDLSNIDYSGKLDGGLLMQSFQHLFTFRNNSLSALKRTFQQETESVKTGFLHLLHKDAVCAILTLCIVRLRQMSSEWLSVVEQTAEFSCLSDLFKKLQWKLGQIGHTAIDSRQVSWYATHSNEIQGLTCLDLHKICSKEYQLNDMPEDVFCGINQPRIQRKSSPLTGIKQRQFFKPTDEYLQVDDFSISIFPSVDYSHVMRNFQINRSSSFSSREFDSNSISSLDFNACTEIHSCKNGHQHSEESKSANSDGVHHFCLDDRGPHTSNGILEHDVIDENLSSFPEKADASFQDEPELQERPTSDVSDSHGTCLSSKVDTTLPRASSELDTSYQATDHLLDFCPKQSTSFNSLELQDTKTLPQALMSLTRTFHGRVPERPSQPPPVDTNCPLTRDTILENMRHMNWRLASMVHMRDFPVHHLEMANAGWFYDEDVDEFRCYCCPAARSTGQWNKGDNPASIHQTLSPDCPHFNSTILDSTTQKADARTSENKEDTENATMVTVIEVVSEDEGSEDTLEEVPNSDDTELPTLTDQSVRLDVSKLIHDCSDVRPREETLTVSDIVSVSTNSKWDLSSTDLADMGENVHYENFELENDFFLSDDTFRHKEEAADCDPGWDIEGDGEVPDTNDNLVSVLNIDEDEYEAPISPLSPFEDNGVHVLSANSVYNGEDITVFQIPVQVESENSSVYYYESGIYENDEDSGNIGWLDSHELFQASTDLGNDEPHMDVNEYSYSEYGAQGEASVHPGSFVGEQLGDSDVITTEDSDLMSDAHNT